MAPDAERKKIYSEPPIISRNEYLSGQLTAASFHYQGISSLKDNSLYGFEALLRINNRFPQTEFELALNNCPDTLTQTSINLLLHDLPDFQSRFSHSSKPPSIFVNFAPEQIQSPNFHQLLMPLAAHTAARHLVLEITEGNKGTAYDCPTIIHTIAKVTESLKCRFAIDDYPTGISQKLTRLLPPKLNPILKIDGSFIHNHTLQLAVVEALIKEADVNRPVVIEKISDEATYRRIRAIANTYHLQDHILCQGYYFDKTHPALASRRVNL